MSSHRRSHLENELEDDVAIAARSRVPVLITASPERALSIARDIISRAALGDAPGSGGIQVCDTSAGDDLVAALAESRLKSSDGGTTFLLKEVHMLSEVEQEAMMKLLDNRRSRSVNELPRLITTSSVSLFDRVQNGSFDAKLFHRLNVIHIVVPINGA